MCIRSVPIPYPKHTTKGDIIATGSYGTSLKTWRMLDSQLEPLHEYLDEHSYSVTNCVTINTSKELVAAGYSGTRNFHYTTVEAHHHAPIKIWSVETAQLLLSFVDGYSITGLAWNDNQLISGNSQRRRSAECDNQSLVLGSVRGTVGLWDTRIAKRRECWWCPTRRSNSVIGIALSPEQHLVYALQVRVTHLIPINMPKHNSITCIDLVAARHRGMIEVTRRHFQNYY